MKQRSKRAESTTGKRPARNIRSSLKSALAPWAGTSARILLAEDDTEMRAVIAHHLRRAGYDVTECRDGVELMRHLNGYVGQVADAEQFDLIISDIRMPGVLGLTVAEGAAEYATFPPMILITAFGDAETHETAARVGVKAVLDKPLAMPVLMDKVREFI